MKPTTCRHCGHTKVNRPRGLCWTCYYAPGVKEQYPSTSKFAHRGVGNFNGNAPLPSEPTDAAPGSAEKFAVLAQRAERGESLWHPDDSIRIVEVGSRKRSQPQTVGEDGEMDRNDSKRTLEDVLGAPPSEAFRAAWAQLQKCTTEELQHLRVDGIRAIQLSRVGEAIEVEVHQ